MENNKITITEELKNANDGLLDNFEIGQETEFEPANDCKGECSGRWVKIGGNCICEPAP